MILAATWYEQLKPSMKALTVADHPQVGEETFAYAPTELEGARTIKAVFGANGFDWSQLVLKNLTFGIANGAVATTLTVSI